MSKQANEATQPVDAATGKQSEDVSKPLTSQNQVERPRGIPRPRTFVRPTLPEDLLLNPVIGSEIVRSNIFITSPFHLAGGTVTGKLNVIIHDDEARDISIGRVALDLIGIEELSWTKRTIFLAIANEFIDENHPLPVNILKGEQNVLPYWRVKSGDISLPFDLNLPSDIGPGSFTSAGARIRYVVFGTILFKVGPVKFLVRCCRDIAIAPLIAELRNQRPDFRDEVTVSEERTFPPSATEQLKVTASLKRPHWFSGGAAFVNVLIQNTSHFTYGKIRLKLIRFVHAYKSSVDNNEIASTGYPRIPAWTEKKVISTSELNIGSRWRGLSENHEDFVTCELEIPRNQLTVPLGRFFEVKYFVRVTTWPKFDLKTKVRVELPIHILHMYTIEETLIGLSEPTSNNTEGNDSSSLSSSRSRQSSSGSVRMSSATSRELHTMSREASANPNYHNHESVPVFDNSKLPYDTTNSQKEIKENSKSNMNPNYYSISNYLPTWKSYLKNA